ncbi:MAG: PEP-CTERM sorting domain-containing protein [Armatimonadetes bacterium]|nr:PEP-CTERM sorting domain-containing protein [Armatimonadota bacterium]
MKRALVLIAVVCLLVAVGTSRVLAHSGEWGPVTFSDLTQQVFIHNDEEPFKGFVQLNVSNGTDFYWTDFHFMITSVNGSNISATIFVDGMQGDLNCDPTSSQSGLTWTIDNNPTGSVMNLYFAADPVAPGSSAWFKIYTDNSTYKEMFGVCSYPTIPEPASMFALLSGLVGVAGFGLRKRR